MSGRENAWQGTPAEERSGSKSGSITAKESKDVGAAWWEYAIIAAVIALILWRNSFHELFLPDFSPARDAYLMKSLELSSYSSLVGFQSLMQAARIAGISAVAVQLVLAAGMCAAYIYLRKLLKKRSLAVMAFVIFAFNPFVYSRFMAGQFGVIIAYLLIPAFLHYLLACCNDGYSTRSSIKAALAFSASAAFQQQFFAINLIILAVVLLRHGRGKASQRSMAGVAIMLIAIVALNAYWLQAAFVNPRLESITASHTEFFAPKSSEGVPAVAKVIGMWGFWREGAYVSTYKTLPLALWYLLLLSIVILMLIGYYASRARGANGTADAMLILWAVGVLLAVGVSHPYTRPIFEFLFAHVPFFKGFRDSHKLVALIGLAYAFLCPRGVQWLAGKAKERLGSLHTRAAARAPAAVEIAAVLIFIGCVILFTYPLIGLWGQVKPTAYPASYAEIDNFLQQQNITGNIVYLPYYDYMTYNWTAAANPDGRIETPINKVVAPLVITDPGPWGARTEQTRAIGACIDAQNRSCLEEQDVQYVLLDKCYVNFNSTEFAWLQNPAHSSECIDTYRLDNNVPVDRARHVPLRFILGAAVSIIALIITAGMLWTGRGRR